MSYRDALKVFKLERELSDDETAFLNTLRKMGEMSESERQLIAETLAPTPVKKPATERHIEHCVACNYTRRAVHHKDAAHKDYHEFQSPSQQPKKSRQAQGLPDDVRSRLRGRVGDISDAIKGTAGAAGRVVVDDGDGDDDARCSDCGAVADDNVHHKRTDPNYHPFLDESPAPSAVGQSSSKNGEGVRSGASSETETEGVGTAHHAAS